MAVSAMHCISIVLSALRDASNVVLLICITAFLLSTSKAWQCLDEVMVHTAAALRRSLVRLASTALCS